MTRFCIHGIFRSGTNFTRGVLEMNYVCRAEYDSFGWKHSPFPILSAGSRLALPDIPSLFVTRNPFYALSALFTYAERNKRNIRSAADDGMTAFLSAPIVIFDGGAEVSPELYFETPVALWNGLNWNYLSTVGKLPGRVHMRYEDLVARPEETAARVAEALGLERKPGAFEVPQNRMRNLGSNMHNVRKFQTDKAFDLSKTLFSSYGALFSEEDRALVLNGANRDLVERAGYAEFMDRVARGDVPETA
ncbi:sulfotransferase [Tropicimonas sediminicola]|nr:sulfotransferase [Tropicimonas sediminicola]